MSSEERKREMLQEIRKAVVAFDEDKVVKWVKIALADGVDPFVATMEGLVEGMTEVGGLYDKKEYFVPELLMCADALYAGLNILRPAIKASGRQPETKGSIILGVVEGDVHDIGKNLIKMMFDVAGWTVYDLGKDVPIDKFMDELIRTNSDIVGLSALMTTSMISMPEFVKKLKEKNPKVRIMLGGAPLTAEIAEKYGADGYAEDTGSAINVAIKLIEMLKREEMGKKKQDV